MNTWDIFGKVQIKVKKEQSKIVAESRGEVDYDDDYQDMVRRVRDKAKAADALKAQGKEPQTKFNPKTGKYYVDHGQDKQVKENAEELNIGDPVIITGNVEFEGKTGEIVEFGRDKRFVIVDLYNHGKHSFHSSDVAYNDHVDHEDDIDEAGYGRNRGYTPGFASPNAPSLGGRGHREDDEGWGQEQQALTTTWYIRVNGKIIKDKMKVPYQYRGKEAARKAAQTMMAKPFNAGKKFTLTTKAEDDQPENEARLHTEYKRNRFTGVQQRDQAQDELSNIAMNRVSGMDEAGSAAQQAAIAINMKKHHNKPKDVEEGKRQDNYHIVNKDGKPASLASYADRASAEKDRDAKHPGAEVRQVGPRGKVKSVSEGVETKVGRRNETHDWAWYSMGKDGKWKYGGDAKTKQQAQAKAQEYSSKQGVAEGYGDGREYGGAYVKGRSDDARMTEKLTRQAKAAAAKAGKTFSTSAEYRLWHMKQKSKKQGVAEAQTDYQRRRQRERDVDAGKPVKPEPRNPQNDYFARRKKERDLAEERTETKNEKGEVTSWRDESDWRKVSKDKDGRGRVTNLSDKARRATEKLKKEKSVDEGWKSALGGAALAGAMALGGGAAHAQSSGEDFLPDIVAHVTFKVNGNTVTKDINLGTSFKSPGDASAALEKFLKSKGIKFYEFSLERKTDKEYADNYLDKAPTSAASGSGSMDDSPYSAPSKSSGDYMAKESIDEAIDNYLLDLADAGYDIIDEEKVRLDPKCWTGKKIGNPKTKLKGGVRVNNCVPK